MRSRSRLEGFTFVELMVSLAILTLIATATVFGLQTTRSKDELNTAARVIASDVKNLQARALAGRDVLQCADAAGDTQVCGSDAYTTPLTCVTPCEPAPPSRYCMRMLPAADFYQIYADIRGDDWRLTNERELINRRSITMSGGGSVGGGSNVVVITVAWPGAPATPNTADICVQRQSGVMRINACGDPGLPACSPTEPTSMWVWLRHNKTNETKRIDVNAVTGRVSIE
ncbi:type II secretion system GspH family protein [Candidatus Uhrbacteria bacterium]|nr:type II secretion system GspH family protein [Candidatus Uhrbacteria bacterium]